MNGDAFVLFLRYPEKGAVKTRLAASLGEDRTYELYRCFLSDLALMIQEVKAAIIIAYSGPAGAQFPEFPGILCLRQRGDDLGQRLYFAFEDVFAEGFDRLVLAGSDIPDLPSAFVNEALSRLAAADIVLGPGTDGGYYLIGCTRSGLNQAIFSGIPWSTPRVFSETLKRVAEAKLTAWLLPEWPDIDDLDDLQQFYARNADRAGSSRVMAFLKAKVWE